MVAKLFTTDLGTRASYGDLGDFLFVSKSTAHDSVRRAQAAKLLSADRSVNPRAAAELFAFGVRYLVPAQLGAETRGIPTSHGTPPLLSHFGARNDAPVWPWADGAARGPAVEPLYETAPRMINEDIALYGLLALIDATRVGRAREVALARAEIKRMFGVEEW